MLYKHPRGTGLASPTPSALLSTHLILGNGVGIADSVSSAHNKILFNSQVLHGRRQFVLLKRLVSSINERNPIS